MFKNRIMQFTFFFFNDTATTEIYTLSLHDALPILTADSVKALAELGRPLVRCRLALLGDRRYGHLARDGRRACDPLARRTQRRATSTVDAGGRCVDARAGVRRQRSQRKPRLSRRELEAL